jgi:hypothetical protein
MLSAGMCSASVQIEVAAPRNQREHNSQQKQPLPHQLR